MRLGRAPFSNATAKLPFGGGVFYLRPPGTNANGVALDGSALVYLKPSHV